MEKIKVVHFVNGLNNGGVEAVILNYFSNIDLESYELHIVTQGQSDKNCLKKFKDLGFIVHCVTRKKESILKNMSEIYKILRTNKFDILHTHMTATNLFPLFLGWLCRIKVRINHSHLQIKDMNITTKIYCKLSLIFTTHKFSCGKAAAISSFGIKSVNNEEVFILNNAISLENFRYNDIIRSDMRKQLQIEDNLVLCNIGRLEEQKNQKFLIDIFQEICMKNKKVCLLIIGKGVLEHELKESVKKLNLEDKIRFLGTRNDIDKIYQAIDIFLLPSINEGLPVVCIESQASGVKTIVSTNITEEINITPVISFLPLEDKKMWENKILEKLPKRVDYIQLLRNNGYDIKTESKKLDEFYRKALEEI